MATRNLRDSRLRLVDGTGTPVTKEVTLLDGKIRWDEVQNVITVLDRGVLDHFRQGDQRGVQGSVAFKFVELFNSGSGSIYEFLKFQGAYSANVSTVVGTDVKTLHLELYVNDPGGGTDELIKFQNCAITRIEHSQGEEYDTIMFDFLGLTTAPALSKTNYP